MTARMVTYRVRDGLADDNAAYVRAVMADLEATAPPGVTYSVWLLDDGVTFVHLVEGDSEPVVTSEAFRRFSATLSDRRAVAPEQHDLTLVGRYAG